MIFRFRYDFSPEEAEKRLQNSAAPLHKETLRQKNTLLYRLRKRSLCMTRTGDQGRCRPQRAFFARIHPTAEGGTALRGRFGVLTKDVLWLLVPSLLLMSGGAAVAVFLLTETLFRVVFAASLLFCFGIIWCFFWLMAHYITIAERTWILTYLQNGLQAPETDAETEAEDGASDPPRENEQIKENDP